MRVYTSRRVHTVRRVITVRRVHTVRRVQTRVHTVRRVHKIIIGPSQIKWESSILKRTMRNITLLTGEGGSVHFKRLYLPKQFIGVDFQTCWLCKWGKKKL